MINDRNWLKNDESVTTKRQKPSGRNWPNRDADNDGDDELGQ